VHERCHEQQPVLNLLAHTNTEVACYDPD
jgi:hypothetical protein